MLETISFMLDHNLCLTTALCVRFVLDVPEDKVALLELATFVLVYMFSCWCTLGRHVLIISPLLFLLPPEELILSL